MINIENQYLPNLNSYSVEEHLAETWCVSNCVIDIFDFSFFDCHFEGGVLVKDNIFFKNSDLLAKEYMGFDNIFANGIIIENNVGRLDVLNLG